MTALDQSIKRWIERGAQSIGPQLEWQMFGLSCGSVRLGVASLSSRVARCFKSFTHWPTLRHYRGKIDEAPVNPIDRYHATVIANRIEAVLVDANSFPTA